MSGPDDDALDDDALGGGALDWRADGAPRSRRFDDVYFSTADGLAESRAVFLDGCGLPQAWAGRARFTVAELGFGTGLNILALLDLWRRNRATSQRLSILSVEAFPLARDEAARALAAWPELADLTDLMLAQWPRRARGFHRLDLPQLGVTLDLAIGEAQWALEQWNGRADAWFLDGFAPAKNPQMWRDEVLALVAARAAPGARAATFTVAGAVRRALLAHGFAVDKRPGHGRKRERLEARMAGAAAEPRAPPRIAIIGAGIAGAALARALAALGARPLILEGEAPGAGASGNPLALVMPGLDAGGGARAAFYAQALGRAADLYRASGTVVQDGALQLWGAPRDPQRFAAAAQGGLFDAARLAVLTPAETSAELGLAVERGGLRLRDGLTVRPAAVIDAWLTGAERTKAAVAAVQAGENGAWRLRDAEGRCIAEAEAVVLAGGAGTAALLPSARLSTVRGQASWATGTRLGQAAAWGGYAAPLDGGLLFGATHDRGRTDCAEDPDDHRRNLETLAAVFPALAAQIQPRAVHGRARLRAVVPDRLPLAGAVGPGLYVLGGLGSRGFTTAPLLAEHVAAAICGAPSPLPGALQRLVDPARFNT